MAGRAQPGAALAGAVRAIGRAAPRALLDELLLHPKPGLVTPSDRGSHDDMDARTFARSIGALRPRFGAVAALGAAAAPFDALQRWGLDAEARMLAATGGVNTHRGAIFTLGLLCAAAGAHAATDPGSAHRPTSPAALRTALLRHWGDALRERARRTPTLPGGVAARRLGLRGAAQEAALGMPVLFEVAVPALQAGRQRGLAAPAARLEALFHVMAVLDDANVAHRGGLDGLRFVRRAARDFLDAGGAARPDALRHAAAIGRAFVQRRLSPGGAADLLAAACWVQRIGEPRAAR